ncbi:MAG: DUF72 domain-containing protein [Synergistales bacterium]|jgi:uncharacterized protein YecE (DUF72 family)
MENLRVGLCSWTDPGLLRSGWYPKEARDAEKRLRHYASRFDVVEVDSTYYAIPDETAAWRWVARTPRGFLFNVKVFGLFTLHAVAAKNLPSWALPEGRKRDETEKLSLRDFSQATLLEIWEKFRSSLAPLEAMGKLGYLLFQFPPGIGFSRALEKYLHRVRDVAGPVRIAVEARNGAWLEGKTEERFLGVLNDLNMAYVAVDEPFLPWTVPAKWPITSSWGSVVRFHGRNSAAWERKDAGVSEKFRYLYSPEELHPWKKRILETAARVEKLFVMFNNCYGDFAVRNATWMKRTLGMPVQEAEASQGMLDYGVPPAE